MANAGFIVAPEWRKKGLGWLLGATMLEYARQLGYRSVIFNLVFSENVWARRLWERLGFKELGVLPGAVRKNDGHVLGCSDHVSVIAVAADLPDGLSRNCFFTRRSTEAK